MKSELFLKEKQELKKVVINNSIKSVIGDNLLSKWQKILNITADITGVSAALIMEKNPDSMEVVLNSFEIASNKFDINIKESNRLDVTLDNIEELNKDFSAEAEEQAGGTEEVLAMLEELVEQTGYLG